MREGDVSEREQGATQIHKLFAFETLCCAQSHPSYSLQLPPAVLLHFMDLRIAVSLCACLKLMDCCLDVWKHLILIGLLCEED